MKSKISMKVSRGRLEHEKNKSENSQMYQRVLMIMLPFIMLAVLAIGLFFGYKSYVRGPRSLEGDFTSTECIEEPLSDTDKAKLLKVINSAHPVDSEYVPELTDFNGIKISPLMLDDLTSMLDAANSDDIEMTVIEGYISFEEQKEKYSTAVKNYKKKNSCSTVKAESAVKKTIPQPGDCEQQTGLVIKLGTDSDKSFSSTPAFYWLSKNSVKYGFVLRYPEKENTGGLKYSDNTFRYVGVDNAYKIRAYNMNFDEFVEYMSAQ